ncbi:polysaccharide deacetylase family protein [Streptomyces sp. NPDC006879]|uniref:polysaccharide deacetylase family protein n=1 Tax=Streptomyces sp. NPDC006879 TaxID=3364767 RepID=UPI003686737D
MWRPRVPVALLAPLLMTVGLAAPATAEASARHRPLPPVVSRVPTEKPVVFLTIDDGWYHDPEVARLLVDERIPATLFLLPAATGYDTGYFTNLTEQGRIKVENHTVNHPDLTTLDDAAQRAEVCGAREQLADTFGRRTKVLRPPYGSYDDSVRRAARACGAKAVVTWTHDLTTWSEPPPTPRLKAGDIVLLHFTPTLAEDLGRALRAAEEAGLKPAPLLPHLRRAGLV